MDSSETAGPERPGRRRGARFAIGLALVVLVAFALALIARDRIAESLARRWLGEHGVASKLKVRALSLTGLKASLRLGDPSDPDFTVDEMDVGYSLSGPWEGKAFGVQTRSLRLVRPRLRLRLSAGHINLGALEPLIQEAAKRPPSGGPAPDVTIEDGVALLLTPDGHVRFRGGGALRGGALTTLDGQVDPFVFTLAGVQVQGQGGGVHLARQGERLVSSADFGPVEAMGAQRRLDAARVTLTGGVTIDVAQSPADVARLVDEALHGADDRP